MEKTKVISVRLPESLIQEVDELTKDHHYWKRNEIIKKAVTSFVRYTDYKTQREILEYYDWRPEKRRVKFDPVSNT